MSNFLKIDDVVKYLQNHGWRGKNKKIPISKRTVYEHVKSGFLIRQKSGEFIYKDVERYAEDFLENSVSQIAKNSISEALDRERLRKLQIENNNKSGELVSLSEEVKRRVAVIQGFKSSLINSKSTFTHSLRESMMQRHPGSETLNALLLDAADLYESAVLEMFDDIERRGRV